MKLVFYDGEVSEYWNIYNSYIYDPDRYPEFKDFGGITIIDAGSGVSWVLEHFERCIEKDKDNKCGEQLIITNSTDLLNYVNFKDIYLMIDSEDDPNPLSLYNDYGRKLNLFIHPLQECCDKELRDCHDIRKLYLSGAFEGVYQPMPKKEGM